MKKYWLVPFIFVFVLMVFFISGRGVKTGHHFFVPLAQGFLKGRLYVDKMEYALHEMIPEQEIATGVYSELVDGAYGKYYVIYPPLPAVILMPAIAIWGELTNQSVISMIIAALSVVISFLVFLKVTSDENKALWLTALYAFGSMLWYHSVVGSAWYFSMICALLFLWLAILATLHKKSLFLIGLLIGLAYLCRFSIILSFPFFLYLTKDQWLKSGSFKIKPLIYFALALSIAVGISLSYNWTRYHRLGHYGYTLLEKRPYNINNEYSEGSYSLSYVSRNLEAMFKSYPNKTESFPYLLPNNTSMALWIVMPALLLIIFAPVKDPITKASWLAVIFTLPASLLHGGIGASQFGYRYALDYMPFLLLLIALAVKSRFELWKKLLFVVSIAVNLWGVWSAFWIK